MTAAADDARAGRPVGSLSRRAVAGAAVLALLHAAVVLAAGKGEYPALTRAGAGFLVEEVLPAAVAAWLSLALLAGPARTARARALAHLVNFAALALAVARFQPSAPPATYSFVIVMALLTAAGLALESASRPRPR